LTGKIGDAKVRQELNGKIADLQSAVIQARQQSIEIQEKYDSAIREMKALKGQLEEKGREVFLHGVWWLTTEYRDNEESERQQEEIYNTSWDGPYCPLCKEKDGKWIHLKPNGQTAPNDRFVYECEVHNTDYESPTMRK
jgi:hypothetical protein